MLVVMLASCSTSSQTASPNPSYNKENLPAPFETKSTSRYSKVVGWPKHKTPIAPEGFTVSRFADGLNNPRWIYQATNGDVFVAESNTVLSWLKRLGAGIHPRIKTQHYGTSANRITMFRDADKDGIVTPDEMTTGMQAEIKTYDTDSSGSLSLAEFEAMHAARTRTMMVRAFQMHDEDGDGQVTEAEMATMATMMQMMMGGPKGGPGMHGAGNGNMPGDDE